MQLARKRATTHESADYERTISVWKYRAEEAEAKLAHYREGVEVEGHAVKMANIFPTKIISCDFPDELIGQQVRVLVMKENV